MQDVVRGGEVSDSVVDEFVYIVVTNRNARRQRREVAGEREREREREREIHFNCIYTILQCF